MPVQPPKFISDTFQRNDQVARVDQVLHRVTRKKASLDALLKNAMESQMDGIRTGMENLTSALDDIKEAEQGIYGISDALKNVEILNEKLKEVRIEHIRHSQYAAAMENLKHIFTVPESVEKTRQWITDGKLLYAHQSLMDLENSRDNLLFELHKHAGAPASDHRLLLAYFAEVSLLSSELMKQVKLTLSRTLNTVRKEPQFVVTALRLVEREEASDRLALQCQKETGFLAPGRPKNWKEQMVEVMKSAVQQRVEGNRPEERETNRLWLVMYLERTRMLILEDLRIVKHLCAPVFPPHWKVTQMYLDFYHDSLRESLGEIVDIGLQGNEYVSLLGWVSNIYSSAECMNHHDIRADLGQLNVKPLLDEKQIEDLMNSYIHEIEKNYSDWLTRAIEQLSADWIKDEPPLIVDSYSTSELAQIIFQMVNEYLEVAKTVNTQLLRKVLELSLKHVIKFAEAFKEGVIAYKTTHFEDRNLIPRFTEHMVALVNTCSVFIELTSQLKLRLRLSDTPEETGVKLFNSVVDTYQRLRNEFCGYLLEEPFEDLKVHFETVMTRQWLLSNIPVDTICVTFSDFFEDYARLRPENLNCVTEEAQLGVARRYITSLLQRKVTLKTPEERKQAGAKIQHEAKQLLALFEGMADSADLSRLAPISDLADVISADDADFLSFELHTLAQKYPDLTQDHLICLLSARGDLGRLDVRQMATDVLTEASKVNQSVVTRSIFSHVHVTASIFS